MAIKKISVEDIVKSSQFPIGDIIHIESDFYLAQYWTILAKYLSPVRNTYEIYLKDINSKFTCTMSDIIYVHLPEPTNLFDLSFN